MSRLWRRRAVDAKGTTLHHPNVVVVPLGVERKTRWYHTMEPVPTGVDFRAHNHNLTNMERAVLERVFFVEVAGVWQEPPQPVPGAFARLQGFKREVWKRIGVINPLTREEFFSGYVARRRELYRQAAESLVVKPLCRRDAQIKAFVKYEKINFTEKPDPAPRLIQPRCPRYNVEVGKFIRPMEHRIYRAIQSIFKQDHPVVMKGLGAQARADCLKSAFSKFKRPVGLGLDAKRFDQHVSEMALRFEHSLYVGLVPYCSRGELRKALELQIHNQGWYRGPDGKLRYKCTGHRASGDMNTALGNVVIVTAGLWELRQQGHRFQILDDGDDCVLVCEEEDLPSIRTDVVRIFLEMGFQLKVEGVYTSIEAVRFCQSHYYEDGSSTPCMVRAAPSSVFKDLTTLAQVDDPKVFRGWLRAVGEGGLALAGGVPIHDAMYQWFLRAAGRAEIISGAPHMDTGFFQLVRNSQSRVGLPITDIGRASFWRATGISPAAQLEIEARFSVAGPLSDPELAGGDGPLASVALPW